MSIPHGPAKGEGIRCFRGVSRYRDTSTAASLHEAIQNAAKNAAKELKVTKGKTVDFEVSRIQIVVGNPNVKVYSVEITPTS